MKVTQRVQALRQEMKRRGIDVYLVPTADCHESEYVGEHFKARVFLTGFTGSAGTAVVTMDQAGLWTDGRYFIQAANQLKGSGITLYPMGEEGVPDVEEFIREKLPRGGRLGFDGTVINRGMGKRLESIAAEKQGEVRDGEDLIDLIWRDRPARSCEQIWTLDPAYAGESRGAKLERVRRAMAARGAKAHILTDLADIAWLFNIRGNDVYHFPVALAFSVVTMTEARLYAQLQAVTEDVRRELEGDGICIRPYEEIYRDVQQLDVGQPVLLDESSVNTRICRSLPEEVKIICGKNPEQEMKAVKNETEVANLRIAHRKDGVAFTKFMYWLKTNIGKIPMDEIRAAEYLEQCRRDQGCFELSFPTICAYNANAAMMHYSAVPGSQAVLKPEGMLLVDSGGHYMEGSTDITRTMILGSVPREWKEHFTLVLRSMLRLASAKFLYGCSGMALDVLARGPLWDAGLDYKCGTGHGVGYLLNIHEGPNAFRWRSTPEKPSDAVLEEGMVTTDEPGVYIEGSHGIRTENELICRRALKNEYGQFMEFQPLTLAPIDLEGIIPDMLSKEEKKQLNQYHQLVFQEISPYLTPEERDWLESCTQPIGLSH